jgi:hypothetical protein
MVVVAPGPIAKRWGYKVVPSNVKFALSVTVLADAA